MPDRRFLTAAELSARWGGSPCVGTLNNWRHKKKGPPFVKFGNVVKYPLDGVIQWESKNERLSRQEELAE